MDRPDPPRGRTQRPRRPPEIDPSKFRNHTLAAMRNAFPKATMPPAAATPMQVSGVHPGDQHVAHIAIACGAGAIITANLRHFPRPGLTPYGICVMSAGTLVTLINDSDPDLLDLALEQLHSLWKNPVKPSTRSSTCSPSTPACQGR